MLSMLRLFALLPMLLRCRYATLRHYAADDMLRHAAASAYYCRRVADIRYLLLCY